MIKRVFVFGLGLYFEVLVLLRMPFLFSGVTGHLAVLCGVSNGYGLADSFYAAFFFLIRAFMLLLKCIRKSFRSIGAFLINF